MSNPITLVVNTPLATLKDINSRHNLSTTAILMTRVCSALALVSGVGAFVAGFLFPLCSWNPFLWMGLAGAAAIFAGSVVVASLFLGDKIDSFAAAPEVSKETVEVENSQNNQNQNV